MTDPHLARLVASLRADPPTDPRVLELLDRVERMEEAPPDRSGVVDFVVNVSHELRTPLNAIIGYAELIEEELWAHDTGLAPDARRIRTAGAQVLTLVNDLLDLSKLESGRLSFHPDPFEVRDLVDEVHETMEPLILDHGNRLEVDVSPDAGAMIADATRVRQCLLNLLANANKFTEGGVLRLAANRLDAGTLVRFEVSDTGIGMSEEELGRLFQRFEQARADTAKRYGGTGLGLALTRELVGRMGGTLGVRSAVGVGTTFQVVLPVSPAG